MKLTDTHRVILTAASGRADAAVLPLPKSVKLASDKAAALIEALLKAGLVEERPAMTRDVIWRTDDTLGRLSLAVAPAGFTAVGIEPPPQTSEATHPRRRQNGKGKRTDSSLKGDGKQRPKTNTKHRDQSIRSPSGKLGAMIASLRSKSGASLDELTSLTGWQRHSVRGAISGALKKRGGFQIDSSMTEGRGRVYRIVG